MKEEWLLRGAVVPVNMETTASLVAEIKRLIDVVGGLILKQGPDYERGFIDGMQKQAHSSVDKAVNAMSQREWVGLTDDEIKAIVGPWGSTEIKGYTRKLFDQIEAKLKEKNT